MADENFATRKAYRLTSSLIEVGDVLAYWSFVSNPPHARPATYAPSSPTMPVEFHVKVRRWLLDAGAGIHVVGRQHLTQQQLRSRVKSDPVRLVIANGIVGVDQTVELWIDQLGFSI